MPGSHGTLRRAIPFLIVAASLLSSCVLPIPRLPFSKPPDVTPTAEALATIEPSPTPQPAARTLTVCLGEEPNTLYPYAGPNNAALSVLAAIDDGPIDLINYEYQPVILTKLPTLADGDAKLMPVDVKPGSKVVDANGALTALAAGTRVRPSSCRADDCVITYDGASPMKMDQLVVTFHLRTDVTWSDGTPLTAEDSVYAYQLAADKSTPNSKVLVDRTQTYEKLDANTTQWWGIPGYLDPSFMANFWAPMPKHAWANFQAAQLTQVDEAARKPIGWGPYMFGEWIAGDHITLKKNPYYYGAAQGAPKFDQLVFRFLSDPNAAIGEMSAGHCDVLNPSIRLDTQLALLLQMQQSGAAHVSAVPGQDIEWLGLGIVPATYDDGINLVRDRPNIFADPRTRQGIALCMDRQKVVDTVLFGQTSVPTSFVPSNNPVYDSTTPGYRYDPAAALDLLKQAGWQDIDGNPDTPLSAVSVKDVPAGTPLKLNYFSTPAVQRRQVIDILTQSLAKCGITLNVQYYDQNDLYAPGPQGLLFGRRFDLIEFAMSTDSNMPPCDWFTSSEIPNSINNWIGTNVSGYQSADFDAACRAAHAALPGEPGYTDAFHKAQQIFATDLPAIPLYYRLRVGAARAGVCHFDLDSTGNPLWNIAAIDEGEGCK